MIRAAAYPEDGVILVNVLSVLALASAVMAAILTLQDISIERSTRFMDTASAAAIALGGETSAVVALRRDALEAPEADHYREAWFLVQDEGSEIEDGVFRLAIEDEQARFNLNNLLTDGLGAEAVLRDLLQALKAPSGLAARIAAFVVERQGIYDILELREAGVDAGTIAALSEVACALPTPTDVNINTASETLLSALLGNPASARLLVSRRDRQGFLTAADLTSARVLMPPRTGLRSQYYAVSTSVTYGTVTQTTVSRLHRSNDDDQPRVAVWSRQRKAAAQLPGPPLER